MNLDQWPAPAGSAASPGRSDETYGRAYAWSLVAVFTSISVALNASHAVLGMGGRSGAEQAMSALVAAVAPLSLLLATELVVKLIRGWNSRRRWLSRLRGVSAAVTAGIAVLAFALSFVALRDMAELMGVSAALAWAVPAVVDAMIVIATLAVVIAEAEMALDRAEAAAGAHPAEVAEEVTRDAELSSRELVALTAHGTDGAPSHDVPSVLDVDDVSSPVVSRAVPTQDETAVPTHGTDGVPSHAESDAYGVPTQRDAAAQVLDLDEQQAVPPVPEPAPEGVPSVPVDDVPSQVDEVVPVVTAHDEPVRCADEARYSDTPAVPVHLHVVPGDGVPTHGGDTGSSSEVGTDGTAGDTAERAGAVVEQFRPDVSTEVVAQMITARRGGASYRELAELAGISANTARRWMLSVDVDVESESTG